MSEPERFDPRADHDLGGCVALVTGGSRGIGESIVRALATYGADIALTTRPGNLDRPELAALLEWVRSLGRGALAVELDVRDRAQIEPAVDAVRERFGRIDVLVNNAGTNVQQKALDVDEATWDLIVDTNLKGAFFVSQAVGRLMADRPRAEDMGYSIVTVGSQMGFVGYHRRAAYCASKAGVVNLTRALAVEWAEHGIRVNAVAPTFVHTELADAMLAEDPAFEREVLSRIPIGRIGEPRDVALAVLYLCGAASRLVTGHTLTVDGGWTAW